MGVTVLTRVAEGVRIHESAFVQSNAIVVDGPTGVLLIDPGVYEGELACLAHDLSESGERVVAGFSTHPHWDHLLWHAGFGDAPRYATARCAVRARADRVSGIDAREHGIPEDVPLDRGSSRACPLRRHKSRGMAPLCE
jgi:glyoxylase-like metal-dependent hydrolase (beta-lactamase superfamily II)